MLVFVNGIAGSSVEKKAGIAHARLAAAAPQFAPRTEQRTTHYKHPHSQRICHIFRTMPPTVHEIDPDYDTVIVLTHPCKDFAPFDPTAEISGHVVSELQLELGVKLVVKLEHDDDNDWNRLMTSGESRKKGKKGKKGFIRVDVNDDASTVAEGSLSGGDARPIVTELSHNADHVLSSEDVNMAEPRTQKAELEEEVVHFHVSSRHLTLASPWFKRTLTSSSFKEAVRNPTNGRFYVNATDWDEEAFLILLNIFHLRKRQIPKIMSVEMLAKIAVLVDYYELEKAEAIEDYVDTWINHVRRSYTVPTSYGRDLLLWVCVSAVFDLSAEFEKATAVAIRESIGSIQTLNLPIPLGATRRFA